MKNKKSSTISWDFIAWVVLGLFILWVIASLSPSILEALTNPLEKIFS